MIGLTTIENFLINYKNPKCLAITKDEHNKYSIMDIKSSDSFTGINMSPRFYINNYYNKNNDEFLIPGYENVLCIKNTDYLYSEKYYIRAEEPIFLEINKGILTLFQIYDIKGFLNKEPFSSFIIKQTNTDSFANVEITKINLDIIKKVNDGMIEKTIYCLPKFNTDETKLLLEIGG